MRVPVEATTVRMNSAENTDIQSPFPGRMQQVINRQTAEVVKQPAVDLKQGPQGIRQGEDQMLPITVWQTVKLSGDPQVGSLFTAGGTGAAVAGVGDVSYVVAAGIIAAIFLHAADAGAACEHFGDGFDFDIAQTASIQEGGPALVSREQLFERARAETGNHGAD
jgi:hypothetical protein